MTKLSFWWRRISTKIFFRTLAAFAPPHREALKEIGVRIVSIGLDDENARLKQNEVWESLKLLKKHDPIRFKRIIKEIAVIAMLLLDNNAEVNIKNNEGATPLHLAAKSGNKGVAELMLAYKADVNARTNKGTTPLRVALLQGHNELADLLREHGGHE